MQKTENTNLYSANDLEKLDTVWQILYDLCTPPWGPRAACWWNSFTSITVQTEDCSINSMGTHSTHVHSRAKYEINSFLLFIVINRGNKCFKRQESENTRQQHFVMLCMMEVWCEGQRKDRMSRCQRVESVKTLSTLTNTSWGRT